MPQGIGGVRREEGFHAPAGCVAVDRALVKEIIQHPERSYVNVHTEEFGAGALRGQISK